MQKYDQTIKEWMAKQTKCKKIRAEQTDVYKKIRSQFKRNHVRCLKQEDYPAVQRVDHRREL